jgi:hypothetical protein
MKKFNVCIRFIRTINVMVKAANEDEAVEKAWEIEPNLDPDDADEPYVEIEDVIEER